MDMKEVKDAAEHFIASGCITLTDQQRMAKFAIAAIPVIEAAEELRKPLKTWTQQEQRQDDLDAALAKLRESE